MKKFVVLAIAIVMLGMTACDNRDNVSKKSEIEMINEIETRDDMEVKTYELQDWEEIYYLGNEEKLVLLKKDDTVILGDDPNVGNHIYEEITIEKGMKLQGAGAYIRVKDLLGSEYGIRTIRDPKDIRVGIGQNIGDQIKTPLSEMSEDEMDYIPISNSNWIQSTTN